jgi:diguanylate cyclase (GGDEF)-like protein
VHHATTATGAESLGAAAARAVGREDLVIALRAGQVVWMSPPAEALLGGCPGTVEELYRRIHPDDRAVVAAVQRRLATGAPLTRYLVRFRTDGWHRFGIEVVDDRHGDSGALVVRATPRDDRPGGDPGLLLDALGDRSDLLHAIIDSDDVIRWHTPAVTRLFGRSVIGARLTDLLPPDEKARRVRSGTDSSPVWRVQAADGVRWIEMEWRDSRDHAGIDGWVLTGWDVTHHIEAERRLLQLTQRDPLTGLPNRLALHDEHHAGEGVVFLNLDRFGEVNEVFGRPGGDRVLAEVATRIVRCVGTAGTVLRPGGDEFVVLAPGDEGQLRLLAEAVRRAVAVPYRFDEHRTVHLDASAGVAVARPDETVEQVTLRASQALQHAKHRSPHLTVWDGAMDTERARRRRLVRELEDAIRHGELDVHFQPVVDTESRRIVGAEALLRWNHPALGLRDACDFVGTAESSGLMPELGRRVLERSVRQAARWTLPAVFRLRVNASATQLTDQRFADDVRAVLAEVDLPPSRLGLEITETTLLKADETVTENLEALRRLGVRIDVDDFGTGYSSLLYLKRLPVDGIKVDRAFVAGLGSDRRDEAIVDSIALLADGLGLDICGEGVERDDHLEGLRRRRIRSAQGWLFSRAVDGDAFGALLATGVV